MVPPGWAAPQKGKAMKANYSRVRAQFRPETRFQIEPLLPAPFRAQEEDPLERLKRRLLAQRLEQVREPEANGQLRRAAHEAAALAWVTPYPLLVFPVLFDERAEAAAARAERQAEVRQRSRQLLAI
jgi:hypothetical protein